MEKSNNISYSSIKPTKSNKYGFISFSHSDHKMVKSFINELTNRGYDLWWDEDIPIGESYYKYITEKIQNCSYAIIILTINSVNSNYVKSELNNIIECNQNAIKPLIIKVGNFDIPPAIRLMVGNYQWLNCEESELNTLIDRIDKILSREKRFNELDDYAAQCISYGEYYEAMSSYYQMLNIAEKEDYPGICLNLGYVYSLENDYSHAIEIYLKGIDTFNEIKSKEFTLLISLFEQLSYVYHSLNDYEKEIDYLKKAKLLAIENKLDAKVKTYEASLKTLENKYHTRDLEHPNDVLLQKVANFQRSSLELMREILKNDPSPDAFNCIKTNVERLMNYCKIAGGLDQIITQCNNDLYDINQSFSTNCDEQKNYSANTKEVKAFRNFLGFEKPGAPDYDVFISYKSEDQKLAERICQQLRRKGKHVFLATDELQKLGKSEYTLAIDDALHHSKHLIVLSTKVEYLTTRWVQHEWSWFESRRRDGAKEGNILLLFEDSICSKKNEFPPTLMDMELFPISSYEERIYTYLW